MMALAMPTPRKATPPELDTGTLERCKAQDKIAFRAFVVRYEKPVFALLSRMLGHGPEVEDLAQEVFLRAFKAFPHFDLAGPARPSTWLLTIATRLALDARKRSPSPLAPPEVLPSRADRPKGTWTEPIAFASVTPETERARRELGLAIARAAERLPDDQRAAFVLAEFHDLTMAEIARALDVGENTAKTRLFRARAALREALAKEWRDE
jgi:RNA polymerase sigma-70 factor (ECF subfamily)